MPKASKQEEPKNSKKSQKKSEQKPTLSSAQWWRAEEFHKEPHEILDTLVKQFEDDQMSRYEAYYEYGRMYGAFMSMYGSDDSLGALIREELSQNELANTIETLWAQVFKNRIVPGISTSDADYDEWHRARAYGRWIEGALDEAKVYSELVPPVGLDTLVFGTGSAKVSWYQDGDNPKLAHIFAERVQVKYLLVDRIEAKHGKPRTLFQKTHIDRFVLFETYKEDREDFYKTPEYRLDGIQKGSNNDDDDLGVSNISKCDMLTVREAWHLPSKPGAKDGRHVIWIRGCTLVDEPYEWDEFPFVFIRYGQKLEGFWGESAVKRIAPTQKNLDKLNRKIDESQDVMGVPRLLSRKNNGLTLAHIDDIPGGIIEVDDINGLRDWNAQCVTPEIYQTRDAAPQKMRALLGISDFESNQKIPDQMRDVSGAMLERWVDQGQARHAMFHRQYEDFIVNLAYMFMRLAEDLQEMGYDVVIQAPGAVKSSIEELSFKEVRLDRKKLKLFIQPTSQLPQTFGGKVEALTKLKDLLPIDPKTIARMTEVPDVYQQSDLLTSDEEIIMKNLHHMVKTGEYLPPLPFDNLELIMMLTTKFINEYRVRKDSKLDRVAILAQYIDDAIALKNGLGGQDPNAPQPPAQIPSTVDALGMQGGPPPGQMPPQGPMPPAAPAPQQGPVPQVSQPPM